MHGLLSEETVFWLKFGAVMLTAFLLGLCGGADR